MNKLGFIEFIDKTREYEYFNKLNESLKIIENRNINDYMHTKAEFCTRIFIPKSLTTDMFETTMPCTTIPQHLVDRIMGSLFCQVVTGFPLACIYSTLLTNGDSLVYTGSILSILTIRIINAGISMVKEYNINKHYMNLYDYLKK